MVSREVSQPLASEIIVRVSEIEDILVEGAEPEYELATERYADLTAALDWIGDHAPDFVRARLKAMFSESVFAGVTVGLRGDRAGIDDDEVGLFVAGRKQAPRGEISFERGTVCLGGTAAEVLNVESLRVLRHRTNENRGPKPAVY